MNQPNNRLRREVAKAIFELVTDYAKHPWLINNGDCEAFALNLAAQFKGGEVVFLEDLPGDPMDGMAHAVFKYGGYYFDAEEPYGVEDWKHLPLAARHLRDPNSYVMPHVETVVEAVEEGTHNLVKRAIAAGLAQRAQEAEKERLEAEERRRKEAEADRAFKRSLRALWIGNGTLFRYIQNAVAQKRDMFIIGVEPGESPPPPRTGRSAQRGTGHPGDVPPREHRGPGRRSAVRLLRGRAVGHMTA